MRVFRVVIGEEAARLHWGRSGLGGVYELEIPEPEDEHVDDAVPVRDDVVDEPLDPQTHGRRLPG